MDCEIKLNDSQNEKGACRLPFHLTDIMPVQPDIAQLGIAKPLQQATRPALNAPFSPCVPDQYKDIKRPFCPVLIKFHPLSPHPVR